jgi:RNA polymerase sigma factor (sigma-70 family)
MLHNENELISNYTSLAKACVSKYIKNNCYEDLLQEAFIALILAYRSYKDTHSCSFTTWAYICINNRLKKIEYTKNYNIDQDIINKEYINIEDVLPQTLNDIEREIIYLRLYNYSFVEIADLYNIKLNTIKSKYRRTIEKIRKANV